MEESSWWDRLLSRISRIFMSKKKRAEQDEMLKRKMCYMAVKSGVCPKTCEICAWDTFHWHPEEK